jgi:hypothetical protein
MDFRWAFCVHKKVAGPLVDWTRLYVDILFQLMENRTELI